MQTQLHRQAPAGARLKRFCAILPAARHRRVTLCRAFAENGNAEAKKKEKVSQRFEGAATHMLATSSAGV